MLLINCSPIIWINCYMLKSCFIFCYVYSILLIICKYNFIYFNRFFFLVYFLPWTISLFISFTHIHIQINVILFFRFHWFFRFMIMFWLLFLLFMWYFCFFFFWFVFLIVLFVCASSDGMNVGNAFLYSTVSLIFLLLFQICKWFE